MRAFLIGLAGLLAYSFIMSTMGGMGIRLGFFAYVINIIFQYAAFALPALLYYRKRPELWPSLRLTPLGPWCLILVIAAAVGMLALNWISVYWAIIIKSIGLTPDLGGAMIVRNGTELIWFYAYGALAPGAFEELLFRGFLLPAFESKGPRTAVIISALLFAMLHGSIEALPVHIVLGIILSLLVLKTGSLIAPMLYHAAHNAIVMSLVYWVNTPSDTATALPTIEEAVAVLPGVLILLFLWGFLLAFVFRKGAQKGGDRLPPAEPAPLPKSALLMLFAAAFVLLGIQVASVIAMLPASS